MTLTGRNTYTGNTTVDGGTLQLAAGQLSSPNQYVGLSNAANFVQSGGTNSLTGGLYVGYSASGSYSLSGAGRLTAPTEWVGYSGPGSFTQSSGTNSVTGILQVGGSGVYNLNGGMLNVAGLNQVSGGTFNLGGGTLGATAPWTSTLNANLTGIGGAAVVDTTGGNIEFAGILSGSGGLVKTGPGSLILAGLNTCQGDVTISAGTLQTCTAYNGGALSSARSIAVNSGRNAHGGEHQLLDGPWRC